MSERTKCSRGALLCIPGLKNLFSFTVRDVSERGIGMRLHPNCRLLPADFMIADDNFQKVRQCHLIWRDGDFAGVEFVSRTSYAPRQTHRQRMGGRAL